ncbi:MAG: ATP-binding protein [Cyanobacteria bacterium J06614_10]
MASGFASRRDRFDDNKRSHQTYDLLGSVSDIFADFSISRKLNVGFGVLILLTFVVFGCNYWGGLLATRNIKQTQQMRVPTALASTQAQQDLLKMSSHVRGYLVTGSSEYRNSYYHSRQSFEQELSSMLTLLDANAALSADNKTHLSELQARYEEWRQIPEELFVLSDQFIENQPALKLFQEQGELALLNIQAEAQQLIDLQAARSPTFENVQLLTQLSAFQNSSALMGASLRAYLIGRNPDFRFEYTGKAQAAEQHWNAITADAGRLTSEQQKAIETIQFYRQQLLEIIPELLAIAESNQYRQDLFLFNTKAEPLAAEMLALLDEIVLGQQRLLEDELELSRASLVSAQWQTLLGSFFALGVALAMVLLLRRKIADPIVRLTRATAQVTEGNLDVKTNIESEDEIGTLAKTFNRMTGYLKSSHENLEKYNQTLKNQKTQLESKNIQIGQALDALQATQAQLIQTEKMSSLGQMVAGIAHEINNPVSFIHGNIPCMMAYTGDLLELIRLYQHHHPQPNPEIEEKIDDIDLDFLKEDIPKTFTSMENGTQRIRDIVLSLRNFSRLDESDMKETTVEEGLESTLLILQNRLNMQAFRPAVQVVKRYGNVPKIECYPGQLNQVFLNLLANAIDALDAASTQQRESWRPQLVLSTHCQEEGIVITISDNGNGIPTDAQPHIFDPFFTTKPIGSGTGMGLSVSLKIVVDRHGGELSCISKQNLGTTFTLQLPFQQTTDSMVSPSSPSLTPV